MLLVDRLWHYHFTLYGRSLLTVKRCVCNRRKFCSQIFGVVCRKGIRYVIQKTAATQKHATMNMFVHALLQLYWLKLTWRTFITRHT